jgi:hypothetical protein
MCGRPAHYNTLLWLGFTRSYLQLAEDLPGQVPEHGEAGEEGRPQVGANHDGPAEQVRKGSCARRQVAAAPCCKCHRSGQRQNPHLGVRSTKQGLSCMLRGVKMCALIKVQRLSTTWSRPGHARLAVQAAADAHLAVQAAAERATTHQLLVR